MIFLNKIIKLNMIFNEGNVPDFGSIELGQDGVLTLLNTDKSKLNSVLTRAGCSIRTVHRRHRT